MSELREVHVIMREAYNTIGNGGQVTRVEADIRPAAFHGWEDYKDEESSRKYAIVEFIDGTVKKVDPDKIKFTGRPAGGNMFEDGLPEN